MLACCVAALGLAACSSGSSSSTGTNAGAAATITIKNLTFAVPPSVHAGARVTVRNDDGFQHTVSADDGQFGVSVNGNGTATFTAPSKPGSYPFHCNIHSTMHGTLTVT